nr:nucleotidyltransferase domain-containing protein [Candidatus Freyarchaeota archaeon]
MPKLDEILLRKERRRARLESSLDSIVSQLKGLGALKIILFGSLARGEVDVHSDLDLFVLMPPTRSGKEWMKLVYENVDRGVASDIIVYNEKEFKENLPLSRFLKNVVNSGKVVYEKAA